MQPLTDKQQRVFEYIRDTIASRQTPPTRAEIAGALGFASPNAAQAHLHTLERKGLIELNARRSRGIRLCRSLHNTASANEDISLAVVGRVAAGAPLLAVEHIEQYCQVDSRLFSARPDYLLRVRGDSMTGAGILDGDLLAVRTADTARPGEIAVLRWDDEVTVKRFYRDGSSVRLVAENPGHDDLYVDVERETLVLEGVAVGVVRSL